MNKLIIIGNLTSEPTVHSATTSNGERVNVCSFAVAVNRRGNGGNVADFFRVSAWRGLGDTCAKFLHKGKKVCVEGSVSVSTYSASDGTPRGNLEVTATSVEFLSPANEQRGEAYDSDVHYNAPTQTSFTDVSGIEEPPF